VEGLERFIPLPLRHMPAFPLVLAKRS